ncbi:hypothetical protein KFK09_029413 [Dendrobium nobile]|uniref:Uncharacterized protein n=1 Tax=Dendrobium nobile TaxID=94219 RepID=A0A8T3A0P9_DENNO|nr:hypothetical protein KFK09_029413 [Dendrobium nobile]
MSLHLLADTFIPVCIKILKPLARWQAGSRIIGKKGRGPYASKYISAGHVGKQGLEILARRAEAHLQFQLRANVTLDLRDTIYDV